MLDQIVAHRCGTLLGESLVIVIASHAIGVAFDFQPQARMSRNDAAYSSQLLARPRPKRIFARVEEDI